MKVKSTYSPIEVGAFPTTIEFSHVLSEKSGRSIYIKHEDQADQIGSGNKVRKINYLFEYLHKQGINHIIADGTTQSNSLMSLVHYAKIQGFSTHCIVYGDTSMIGNYSLIARDATTVTHLDKWDAAKIEKARADITGRLEQDGSSVYSAPTGLSSPETLRAGMDIADEIFNYERQSDISFDDIIVAAGTGSTVAGLSYKDQKNTGTNRVVGAVIANNADFFKNECRKYFTKLGENELALPEFDQNALGRGYGLHTQADERLQRSLLESGEFYDSVYMLKTVKCALNRALQSTRDSAILVIHTGGNNQRAAVEEVHR